MCLGKGCMTLPIWSWDALCAVLFANSRAMAISADQQVSAPSDLCTSLDTEKCCRTSLMLLLLLSIYGLKGESCPLADMCARGEPWPRRGKQQEQPRANRLIGHERHLHIHIHSIGILNTGRLTTGWPLRMLLHLSLSTFTCTAFFSLPHTLLPFSPSRPLTRSCPFDWHRQYILWKAYRPLRKR